MSEDFLNALDELGIDHTLPAVGVPSKNIVTTKSVNTPLGQAPQTEVRRTKPKKSYKQRKAEKILRNMAEFQKANPGVIQFVRENASWSDFHSSLLNYFLGKGFLTDGQVAAVRRSQAKMAENAKKKEEIKVEVDLSPIKEMFDTAQASGLKKTTYRAEGLVLSLAGSYSANAGAIYVKSFETGAYLGKVVNNKFAPVSAATDEDKAALLRIAKNPKEAAVRWGQQTGRCSCCGAELTNKASIAAGIGPICASKWGL